MAKHSVRELDLIFSALSDPTRRAMLARLARGPATITELGSPFRISLPAVMKHVAMLSRARLVRRRKLGRVRRCTIAPEPLRAASRWIDFFRKFWEQQFDSLEHYLRQTDMSKEDQSTWNQPKPARPYPRSASSVASPGRARKSSAPGRVPKR